MLQNLTNFFSLITNGMIKSTPDKTDLIALGSKDPRYQGGYKPTAITYENLKASVLSDLSEEKGCGVKFGLNWASVGPKVSFKKPDYAIDYRDVIIPGWLELTRKNNQGLYNAAQESGWDQNVSPVSTQWNSQFTDLANYGWSSLANIIDRGFGVFYDALDQSLGCEVVGKELVLRETDSGRMWIIKFTEWTQGGNGGGFAYDRWEIFPLTYFYRPFQSPYTVDKVSEGLIIKRDNYRGLYNAALETRYDSDCDKSPLGTEWNSLYTDSVNYGTTNMANVRNRKYGTWREAVNANPPGAVSDNLALVMHDLSTDLYWLVFFTYWAANGNNGEFSYIRQLIPQDCGIEFNDGSVMTSAANANTACCPTIDNDGNTIIDNVGANLVSIGAGAGHLIDNFSGMVMINDHFSGRVETWIAGSGDAVLLGYTAVGSGVPTSTMTMSGSGYVWTNNDNLNGPFTIAVIKTRTGS